MVNNFNPVCSPCVVEVICHVLSFKALFLSVYSLVSNIHGPWDEAVIKEEHVAKVR